MKLRISSTMRNVLVVCVVLMRIFRTNASIWMEFGKRDEFSANGVISKLLLPFEVSAGKGLMNLKLEPETNLSTIGLIRRLGYTAESHTVTTADGYILELHRIPFGRRMQYPLPGQPFPRRTPILLQHGLLCSSADFANNLPHQSLAYILADNGFDVWLGNSRGNTYSRRHVDLDPEKSDFWQFSWDEMALFDLPATIDYILDTTGFRQLHYIGHSQGTTIAFALLSTYSIYNDKIASFIALGPVTDLKNNKSPISVIVTVQEVGLEVIESMFALAPITDLKNIRPSAGKAIGTIPHALNLAFKAVGYNELLPNTNLVKFVGGTICNSPSRVLCDLVLDSVFGYNPAQLNETRWPVYLTHFPAGTSSQNLVHWAQIIHVKDFRRFDHGPDRNMVLYNQDTPPSYDVSKITTPVALIYTEQDPLAVPEDTKRLADKLRPNLLDLYRLGDDQWVHMDLVWGPDSGPMIFSRMRKVLRSLEYNKQFWK